MSLGTIPWNNPPNSVSLEMFEFIFVHFFRGNIVALFGGKFRRIVCHYMLFGGKFRRIVCNRKSLDLSISLCRRKFRRIVCHKILFGGKFRRLVRCWKSLRWSVSFIKGNIAVLIGGIIRRIVRQTFCWFSSSKLMSLKLECILCPQWLRVAFHSSLELNGAVLYANARHCWIKVTEVTPRVSTGWPLSMSSELE